MSVRLLHFAPEAIFHNIFSQLNSIEYWTADISPEHYRFSSGAPVLKADITDIPFKDNWFDVVLANHVLEHIPDDRLAMAELFRVLKPGGWAILQVPIHPTREETYEDWSLTTPEERLKHFGQADHVRYYGTDYKDRLVEAGFKVTVDEFVNLFTEEQRNYFGLMDGEYIYYCEKQESN